eukprot:13267350-Ditylum_brightwellii.AAC.1
MIKRSSEVPHEPNLHPSGRVEVGTDAGISGGTVPPGDGESNNDAPDIPSEEVGASVSVSDAGPSSVIPSSKASKSNVGPVTNTGESVSKLGGSANSDAEEKPNTTSESTSGIVATMGQKESCLPKPNSPTSQKENDDA